MRSDATIRTESFTDQVLALLERQIAGGKLAPGERIFEKELARRLHISRTPIREALLKLEAKGLVVFNSRRSYTVRTLAVQDVKEIYQALGILEGAMVAAVAGELTPADLRLLGQYNVAMERAAKKGNLQAFGQYNRKFHDLFLSRFENRTMLEACHLIRRQLYTFPVRRKSLSKWLGKSVREHREIIKLAASKDRTGLAAYFRDVHWSYEKNLRYIEDAFDRHGEAAVHF